MATDTANVVIVVIILIIFLMVSYKLPNCVLLCSLQKFAFSVLFQDTATLDDEYV